MNMEPTKIRKKKCPMFEDCYIKKSNTKKECKFCGKVITGQSITRIKRHWAGVKGGDVLPCPNVLDSVRKSAMEDVKNWENRQKKEKPSPGRPTNESPSRPHDSLNRPAHEEPSRHLPSSQEHIVKALQSHPSAAAITPTKPYNNDDTTTSMDWAIQKWFFLNELPYEHLYASEFHQLYRAIVAAQGSSSLHIQPPVALIDNEFILGKLEDEVADYVRTVRSSWSSTRGCTICIMKFKILEKCFYEYWYEIIAATAHCHQGTIFLKDEINCGFPISEDEYNKFLNSIIKDVGLDNITQILLPRGNLFWKTINDSTDIKNIMCKDMAYNMVKEYSKIFKRSRLVFGHYACFITKICCCVEGLTILRDVFNHYNTYLYCDDDDDDDDYYYYYYYHDDGDGNLARKLSMMLNKKQIIDNLLGEMQHQTISNLSFWNSKEAYDDVYHLINAMFRVAKKDYPPLPTFDRSNQETEKQNVCKLITDIIAGDKIIPNSIFWKSVEAFICLYKHIHKTARYMSNNSFTFENYLVAYLEAKSILREEYFHKEDYQYIMTRLDGLLPYRAEEVACYSCPLLRHFIINAIVDSTKIKAIKDILIEMGSDANKLEDEYASYYFKEVLSPTEIIYHSKIWWETQRDTFPRLHKLAIMTLNKICSSTHVRRILFDMYEEIFNRKEYGRSHDLLPIRLNNHFKHIATNYQDDNSALIGTEMVNDLVNFTDISFFDFTIDKDSYIL